MPRAKESTAGASTAQAQQEAVSDGIETFELPRSLVMKLARASQVPESTKFSKEVILSILKASTVFINYLAATAHEVASQKQHKSISATDVLKALELIEFTDIAKSIQAELPVYRDLQRADKRKGGKGKAKDTSDSASRPPVKGKAKASTSASDQAEPSGSVPTIHIPRPAASASASAARTTIGDASSEAEPENGPSEDVDEDHEMADAARDDDQDDDVEDEMDEDEDKDEDDGEEEEAEPLEDPMALEDEEIRKDAKGLDADNAIDED
ncbi:histone-fold-containing protein [Daedaleopsis nitida]|nr:histone-fold-containing protein [Daedaleopsis nitida]